MPPVSKEMQIKHGWNADDRSLNIFVKVIVHKLIMYFYFHSFVCAIWPTDIIAHVYTFIVLYRKKINLHSIGIR